MQVQTPVGPAIPAELHAELTAARAAADTRLARARQRTEAASLAYQIRVGMRERVIDEITEGLCDITLTHGLAAVTAELGVLLSNSARTTDAFERAVIEAQAEAARRFVAQYRQYLDASAILARIRA